MFRKFAKVFQNRKNVFGLMFTTGRIVTNFINRHRRNFNANYEYTRGENEDSRGKYNSPARDFPRARNSPGVITPFYVSALSTDIWGSTSPIAGLKAVVLVTVSYLQCPF